MTKPSKLIYVSGATGYLGKATTKFLLCLGYSVLLGGRDTRALARQSEELSHQYGKLVAGNIQCDLSNPVAWNETINQLNDYKIAGYVNCSGKQGRIAPITELDIEEFTSVSNVNCFSSVFFTKYFLTRQNEKSTTSVIHFSGGGATNARPYFSPYSLSKTALVRFVENVASEQNLGNFRINVIAPGVMPSQMQSEILDNVFLRNSKEQSLAQASVEDTSEATSKVLKLVEFLLSEKADGISGKLISAQWDNWEEWPNHLEELKSQQLYTLRRLTARDRNLSWGDV
jgi:3-oxoacyl-[acyl-carrier protein] reductase